MIVLLLATYAAIIVNTAGVISSMMLVHDLTVLPDLIRNCGVKNSITLEDNKRGLEHLARLAGTKKGFVWRFNT